jgi:hypothetical protein
MERLLHKLSPDSYLLPPPTELGEDGSRVDSAQASTVAQWQDPSANSRNTCHAVLLSSPWMAQRCIARCSHDMACGSLQRRATASACETRWQASRNQR